MTDLAAMSDEALETLYERAQTLSISDAIHWEQMQRHANDPARRFVNNGIVKSGVDKFAEMLADRMLRHDAQERGFDIFRRYCRHYGLGTPWDGLGESVSREKPMAPEVVAQLADTRRGRRL